MLAVGNSLASLADRSALTAVPGSAERSGAERGAPTQSEAGAASGQQSGQALNTDGVVSGARPVDAGVKAYEAAAQKLAASGGSEAAITDPQTAAELAQLKATDAAVRAHEAAHVGAGGSYVQGGASFTYQEGPDGKQYAIGGEVAIDTAPVPGDPQATISKMLTVRSAALAPADPSAADRAVAASAAQQEAKARLELLQMQAEKVQQTYGASAHTVPEADAEQPVFSAVA